MQSIYSHTNIGVNNVRILDADVKHLEYTIPTGFQWDGASVPRLFWFFMPKWGEHSIAFLMHDFLYSAECPYDVSRAVADKIMYNDLCDAGVNRQRAWLVYKTVRLFGSSYFRK